MPASGRVAVVVVARGAVTLGVYALGDSGRLRAHARRAVALAGAGWPALRDALGPLLARARARGAGPVVVAVRASAGDRAWIRRAAPEARRLRCELLAPSPADELRWLFLGGVRAVGAQDGVVAELEPDVTSLARFRGRVLAAAARIGPRAAPASSGLALGGVAGALVVSGSLAQDAGGRGAAALKRLLKWTRAERAVVARDALAAGLAATLLRAPVPDAFGASRPR